MVFCSLHVGCCLIWVVVFLLGFYGFRGTVWFIADSCLGMFCYCCWFCWFGVAVVVWCMLGFWCCGLIGACFGFVLG